MNKEELKLAAADILDQALSDGDLSDLYGDLAELVEDTDISVKQLLAEIPVTIGHHSIPGYMPDDDTLYFTFDLEGHRGNLLLEMAEMYYDSDDSISEEVMQNMKNGISSIPDPSRVSWYGPDGHLFEVDTMPVLNYLSLIGYEDMYLLDNPEPDSEAAFSLE